MSRNGISLLALFGKLLRARLEVRPRIAVLDFRAVALDAGNLCQRLLGKHRVELRP